jgi:hypothetical protein
MPARMIRANSITRNDKNRYLIVKSIDDFSDGSIDRLINISQVCI